MTYVDNISLHDLFVVRYKGLRLLPSRSAEREIVALGIELCECKKWLERGYLAPRKRSSSVEEKWFDAGRKTYNIVVARDFNSLYNEEVFIVMHIGIFGRKRWIKK